MSAEMVNQGLDGHRTNGFGIVTGLLFGALVWLLLLLPLAF